MRLESLSEEREGRSLGDEIDTRRGSTIGEKRDAGGGEKHGHLGHGPCDSAVHGGKKRTGRN